jgi:hypothetical protein
MMERDNLEKTDWNELLLWSIRAGNMKMEKSLKTEEQMNFNTY